MNKVSYDCLDKFVLVYLDDILVYSSNVEQHKEHLRTIFERLWQHKLFEKHSKYEFGQAEINYLGHVVGNGMRKADFCKIQAVA